MDYQPTENHQQSETLTFTDYYRGLLKRKWLILLVFVSVLFISVVVTIRSPKIYEAVATVEIDLQADQVLSDVNDVYKLGDVSYWDNKSYFETQYQILHSRRVALAVVERLHLDRDLAFLGLDEIEDEAELAELLEEADPAETLLLNLIIEPVTDSRLALIRYRGTDPQQATTIANAVAEAYIEQNLERKTSSARSAISWLSEQVDELKSKLEESERALYEFKKENDILSTDMDERVNITGTRLSELYSETRRAETEYVKLKAQYESMQRIMPEEDVERIASMTVLQSPLIKDLKVEYVRLQNQYSELLQVYKERHPDVLQVKSQLDRTKENLRSEVRAIINGVRAEFEASRTTFLAIQSELDKVKDQAKLLTLKQVEYNRLLREKESNQGLFQQVLVRLKEIDLSSMLEVNNIRMLDEAKVPIKPIRPRVKLNLALGFMLALIFSVGLAVLLEILDKTLKNAADIGRYLKVPLLGVVPQVKVDQQLLEQNIPNVVDRYAFLRPKSSLAECCRSIRTNINFVSPGKPLRRILVTSASPREGKTTIVSNIGITMANLGRKVLILDTDMRRPRLHKAFNMKNEYGLSNIIMGTMNEAEAVRKTEIENLTILTCGPIPPNPAELVGSERFKTIIDNLSAMYDMVILDSPPVIAVADSLILSNLVDGVVMIVKSGKTLRDVAIQAKRSLTDVKANLLGAIINDLDLDSKEYGSHYYYYYHRYGYYNTDKETQAETASS